MLLEKLEVEPLRSSFRCLHRGCQGVRFDAVVRVWAISRRVFMSGLEYSGRRRASGALGNQYSCKTNKGENSLGGAGGLDYSECEEWCVYKVSQKSKCRC